MALKPIRYVGASRCLRSRFGFALGFFMPIKTIALSWLLLVSLLFGTDRYVYAVQPITAQPQLLKAPTELNIGGVKLAVESEAYLNLMPTTFVSPDRKIDCAWEGPLVVPIRINVSALPEGTIIENVWVHTDTKWWSGSFNPSETRKGKDHVRMIARGCPAHVFSPMALTDVVVEVRYKGITQYLRAPVKQLGAAH